MNYRTKTTVFWEKDRKQKSDRLNEKAIARSIISI